MGSKYTKRCSEEFKRDTVALVAPSGRTVTEVAQELRVSSESLRGWVKIRPHRRGLALPISYVESERGSPCWPKAVLTCEGFPRNTDSVDCDEGAFHRMATWLDLATREVIGYSMADHRRADLVVDALDMAAGLGRLEESCSSTPTADRVHLRPIPRQARRVEATAEHGAQPYLL